jgi:hypothetical protein
MRVPGQKFFVPAIKNDRGHGPLLQVRGYQGSRLG